MIRTRDDARRRITVRALGNVSLPDVLSLVQQQQDDETWHYAVLYDLRAMGPVPSGVSQVRLLATGVAGINPSPPGPVAIVATDVDLYGRACSYAALVQPLGRRFQVFRDMADAESWLDAQAKAP